MKVGPCENCGNTENSYLLEILYGYIIPWVRSPVASPPYVQYGATLSRPVLNDPVNTVPLCPPGHPRACPAWVQPSVRFPQAISFPLWSVLVVPLMYSRWCISYFHTIPGDNMLLRGRRKGAVLPKDPPTTSTHATPLPFRSHTTP